MIPEVFDEILNCGGPLVLTGNIEEVKSNSGHIYLLALVLKVCRTPGPTVCLYKHAAGYRQHTINSDAGSLRPLAAGMTA